MGFHRSSGRGVDVPVDIGAVVSAFTVDRAADTVAAPAAAWRHGRAFTWVTSSGRALPVRVDTPSGGQTRGAVVIVPSLGREAVVSYRTVRSLAMRAARAGLVALTFSLSGDGDSEDLSASDDAVTAWLDDVRAVAAQARELVGDGLPVNVVGLRLGGALVQRLADHVATTEAPDEAAIPPTPVFTGGAFVAWEPISGTAFLRHHTQLRASGVPGEPVQHGVELDGFLLSHAQAASLRTLDAARRSRGTEVGPQGVAPGELHIRFESDRRASVRLALGATYFAHVPLDTLDSIVASLPVGAPRRGPEWTPVREATLTACDEIGRHFTVTERLMDIGPNSLPAILTRDPSAAIVHGLTLTAMGAEVKWGPGRIWTRAARALAPAGVVSLRADRGLIGDDIDPDNTREPDPYTDASVDDVCDAVTALCMQLPASGARVPVAVAGVCAGTWSQLRAAAERPVDTVIAVNPVHWNPDASLYTRAFYDHYHGEEAPELDNPSHSQAPSVADCVRDPRRAIATSKDMLSREVAIRCPRLRSLMVPVVPVDKVRYLLDDIITDTRIHLVLGTEEERIFNGKGGRRAIARARRRGVSTTVERLGNLDHSLLSEKARLDTLGLLRRLLTRA